MRNALALAAALCALAAALPAGAAGRPRRIMVLDFPADETFKPNVTKALNDFLASALHEQGFEVVTAADIAAVLGVERQKQLLGCGESSCLAEIGGAMGADYIVRGNAAVLETDTALTLSLVDSKGKPLNITRKLVAGRSSGALLKAVEEAVPGLVEPIRARPEAAPAAAGGLKASAEPEAQPARSRVPAYALLGLGGAGLIASGIFGGLSLQSYGTYRDHVRAGDDDAALQPLRSDVNTRAGVAWGALGVGVVAAAAGTYLLLSGD